MSKNLKQNYLTKDNGCFINQTSSEREDATASNILTDNAKQLWVIKQTLPQFCIINTSEMKQHPKVFNRVGFYCWHQYESNPEVVELAHAKRIEDGWNVVGKIRLQKVGEKQYFKIKDIPVTEMKYLKLTILKNFGDKSTYLNKIQLGYVKEAQAESLPRQKNLSEYVKLTSTQRQLKRALDQIKIIRNEQEELKFTVSKQNDLIFKMQEEVKILVKHIEKLYNVQEEQKKKILQLQGNRKEKQYSREKSRQYQKDMMYHPSQVSYHEEYVGSSEEDAREKKFIEEDFMRRKTVSSKGNKSISYSKSHKQSTNKAKQYQIYPEKRAKISKMLKSRQANDSSPNLSQYNESDNQRSMQSQKCTELVQKLQRLLAERDKRAKEQNRRSQNH